MRNTAAPEKSSPDAPSRRKIAKKISPSYLENAGKHYLERFPASVARFRAVMLRKIRKSCGDHPSQSLEESVALLDSLIGKFQTCGFLNDDSYAQALVYSLRGRGYSRRRIEASLRQKGLSGDIIETLLTQESGNDFLAALKWVRRKRLGPYAKNHVPGDAAPDKHLASLGRAGFSYEVAKDALSLSKEEIEEKLSEESL
jgi:regulatory protein